MPRRGKCYMCNEIDVLNESGLCEICMEALGMQEVLADDDDGEIDPDFLDSQDGEELIMQDE